jgi:hypothetical protein
VLSNTHLSTKNNPIFDSARSSHPGQSGDDHASADLDVVGHLHQIVDLGAVANAGWAEFATIDTRARSDFNIAPNFNGTQMGNPPWKACLWIRSEAETIRTDDHALLQNRTISQFASGCENGVGTDHGVLADLGTPLYDGARM